MVSNDVVDIIADVGIASAGRDLFVAPPMPDKPDNCISVWDTGSFREPDPNLLDYRYPTIQVRVRSGKRQRQQAVARAQQVRDLLHNWRGIVGDSRYLYIRVTSEPSAIGSDDLGRLLFSLNFAAQWAPAGLEA